MKRSLLHFFGRSIGIIAFLFTGVSLLADGGFVFPKFVWNKAKDISEPSQKAIIFYDNGREDLVLQVKYEGPVSEFGWLIPVPSRPTVTTVPMACFYELSKFVQEELQGTRIRVAYLSMGGGGPSEPKVKVLEVKTVGAYDIAVLSAEDSGALKDWLAKNQFQFPEGKENILDHYVQKHWIFAAIRVHLDGRSEASVGNASYMKLGRSANKAAVSKQLHRGELNPLALTFDSLQCVFPLKISSILERPSEVHVYVIAKTPMTNAVMAKIANSQTNRTNFTGFFPKGMVPTWAVTALDLPKTSKFFLRFGGERWIMTKQEAKFASEEMEDLEFQNAFPEWLGRMGSNTNLLRPGEKRDGVAVGRVLSLLGPAGRSVLIRAAESPDAETRVNAAFTFGMMRDVEARLMVLKLLQDEEWTVRVAAARYLSSDYSSDVTKALAPILRENPTRIPGGVLQELQRQQYFLNPEHQRELIPVLTNPDRDAVVFAYGSTMAIAMPDEIRPMLEHRDPFVRLVAVRKLEPENKLRAIELCLEMLSGTNSGDQWVASETLRAMTGQNIRGSEGWMAWWRENKETFRSLQK